MTCRQAIEDYHFKFRDQLDRHVQTQKAANMSIMSHRLAVRPCVEHQSNELRAFVSRQRYALRFAQKLHDEAQQPKRERSPLESTVRV